MPRNKPRFRHAVALLPLLLLGAALPPRPAMPAVAEDLGAWPPLVNPFPSTGGGGVMIDGYDPVIADGLCRTPFRAILPDGAVFLNQATFDAVPMQGGILCTNGRWRAADGAAEGTTPFRMFVRDGVVRRAP